MHVLDSSAIAIILRRLREKSTGVLEGKITLDLARYELGNVIWKECALKGLIGSEEAKSKAEGMAKMLEITEIKNVKSSKDFRETMQIALGLDLTFYDASYLHIAKSHGHTLVTEDEELREKAKHADTKATTISELLRQENWS
ncbi:MAG: type II toxin-antitoxin system VapC family toxin [Candidatus Bathyarchaeia archaeon]